MYRKAKNQARLWKFVPHTKKQQRLQDNAKARQIERWEELFAKPTEPLEIATTYKGRRVLQSLH